MKKKFLVFIVMLLLYLSETKVVLAKSYRCIYKWDDEWKITYEIDSDKKKYTRSLRQLNCFLCQNGESYITELDMSFDVEVVKTTFDSKETYKNFFSGKCDSTLLVFKYFNNSDQRYHFKALFNDTYKNEAIKTMQSSFGSGQYKELEYKWVEFDKDESTAPSYNFEYKCKKYDSIYENIKNSAESYKNCNSKGTQCSKAYQDYILNKNDIKNYCDIQFQYGDTMDSCVQKCLKLNEDIESLGIENNNSNGECGLSGNIIKWIKNILKWIKYILPVLVIILGIIYFIKAIASGSDDEMKKAQGRFIKRLIAAALLFLVPALIEFIINVFNIESTFCGITD